jgi:predicted HAD superfamily Cof-like phosphohydrolase
MNLTDSLEKVRQFHQHIGAPVSESAQLLACDRESLTGIATQVLKLSLACSGMGAEKDDQLLLRLGMLLEEVSEWVYAHARGDLVAAADAWADHLYVLLGDAVAAGLPAEDLFEAIHASNMTKAPGQTSWPGKAVKDQGYQPPDVARVLQTRRART